VVRAADRLNLTSRIAPTSPERVQRQIDQADDEKAMASLVAALNRAEWGDDEVWRLDDDPPPE
jgi:hypothetical protein